MRYEIKEHRGYFTIALDGRELLRLETRGAAEKLMADFLDEDRPNIIKFHK
jgi:hypothetical protein